MKVTKSNEQPWTPGMTRGAYENRRIPLGGEKLSSSLWELPAGKKSFPMHAHQVTEEALFVISGHAKVRTPAGETPIGPGDYVSFPPGGPAHQLVNDGTETLRYLAMSVNHAGVDVVDYPESGKTACAVGTFPTGKRMIFRTGEQADYFENDKDA